MYGSMTVGELRAELERHPAEYRIAVSTSDEETSPETCHKIDPDNFDCNDDARVLYMTVYK